MDRTYELASEALTKGGVRFLLGGGFAVNAHGYGRGTEDIDFLVEETGLEAAENALVREGFSRFRAEHVVTRLNPPSGMKLLVDLLPVDAATFEKFWAAAEKQPLRGVVVPVLSLDHLLAMKLHAMKNDKLSRGLKDLLDIVELAKKNGISPDSPPFKELCLRYGGEESYRSVVRALGGP